MMLADYTHLKLGIQATACRELSLSQAGLPRAGAMRGLFQ